MVVPTRLMVQFHPSQVRVFVEDRCVEQMPDVFATIGLDDRCIQQVVWPVLRGNHVVGPAGTVVKQLNQSEFRVTIHFHRAWQ